MQSTNNIINPKKWAEWLKVKGLSERSIRNYYFYFEKFNFEELNQDYTINFLSKYNNSVCRAFIKSIIEYLKIKTIELPKITGRKKYREPEIIGFNDVRLLSNAMRTERNKIMVLVNFYGGLRVSELVNIKPYDINWKKWVSDVEQVGYVKIIGKGNKQRTVFLPGSLMKRIYQWLHEYDIGNKQSKDIPLFRIKVRRYEVLLSGAGLKGLGKSINPHCLRHSCATYLFENQSWNIKEVKEYLGHKSIVTTERYLHLNKDSLAKKFKEID